jgi:hypothetical protein
MRSSVRIGVLVGGDGAMMRMIKKKPERSHLSDSSSKHLAEPADLLDELVRANKHAIEA